MGGRGSGRHAGLRRITVEECRSIDVKYLSREGCFLPGRNSVVTWHEPGGKTEIAVKHHHDQLHLSHVSDRQLVSQIIDIDRSPCRFGGSRPYFICPGPLCGRRVEKLYVGRYILCRHCHCLGYTCQREQIWDRKARRAGKIRQRLGGEAGIYRSFPEKPKGMWWRTYERLAGQVDEAAFAAEQAILARR
jgi:hypothetical protein